MPHLTISTSPDGPIINIGISVSHQYSKALLAAGSEVPQPIVIRALIDTGASCTCIDPHVIKLLNILPTGTASVHTPSTEGVEKQFLQYDVSIFIQHPTLTRRFGQIAAVETILLPQGIHALIGRDILKDCLLVYDGQSETCTISF